MDLTEPTCHFQADKIAISVRLHIFKKNTITTGRGETQFLYFPVPIYPRKCMVPNILLLKICLFELQKVL